VWASWCLECEREHSYLIALSNNKNFDLVGINYKDNADDAKGWLNMRGNPYRIIIADFTGDLSLDLGVYGVPETYIIDKNQVILYKHIGPINNKIIQQEMMPLLGMNE
jgi:cytochrome c biogenesis protein CcmG/thiol:disulfide interchange protein DsbE